MSKENKLEILRHSAAHVLAAAVLEMFPEAKFGMGPATEDGFFYDFELPRTLIPEDLPLLEEKMQKIIKADYKFERAEISIKDATEHFEKLGQTLKTEIINDLEKDGVREVSIYKSDHFVDLCSGPHLESTGKLNPKALKLTRISGAYWKSDEKNQQLQRIYGVVFETEKELKEYLEQKEEALKRDHRKLGKELDLFCFSDLVGSGLPLYTPRGTTIIEELQKHIETICRRYGFQKVKNPHLAKRGLFEISGHAIKFSDELFSVTSPKNHEFSLKPVQCPHHTQIYASKMRSYKDLPIRYMESDKQYRAEKTGEVGGLNRVYAITVEDGHSFCRVDQVKDEVINIVKIIKDFYSALGLWENHWVSLSVRDYTHPEKYIGTEEDWDLCEKMLQEISDEMGLDAKKCEGEAALYGPKLDFMFKDTMGKEIQIPTIQLDFATPKRFELTYINEKGEKAAPVMVHRAVLGSYERFLALLIEHFAGAFPVWLSPVQAIVIPVSEKFEKYAQKVNAVLEENNIRSEISSNAESLGKRIREAEKQKIPYMLIVGEKEEASIEYSMECSIRRRGDKNQETMPLQDFIQKITQEIQDKK